jgi:hypothetical protein
MKAVSLIKNTLLVMTLVTGFNLGSSQLIARGEEGERNFQERGGYERGGYQHHNNDAYSEGRSYIRGAERGSEYGNANGGGGVAYPVPVNPSNNNGLVPYPDQDD